jgi:hypothetical protein
MKAKLTLSIDERLIQKAKRYAREQGASVSELVERYFAVLGDAPNVQYEENSAFTRSLRGAISDPDVAEADYHRYLDEKHR